MSKTTNIFLILLTCISLSACQEDDFGSGAAPDMATLIAQGKYLTARNAETFAAQVDPEKGAWFPDGTPFRLLAFTKPYAKDNDYEKDPANYNYAKTIRFNEVTWEGETETSFGDIVRYININGDPDKMFGFKALTSADGSLSDEVGNDTSLVALDFYGFTYGKKAAHNDNYIPLDPIDGITSLAETGNETPTDTSILEELKRTETVSDDGKSLNDLMRGQLLNCDILPDKNEVEDIATQSIIPFKHCFSHLQFMVVQEPKDNNPDKGGEIQFNKDDKPSFENLYVENVTVTGTYGSGAVYLKDGKVELSDPIDRPLQFNSEYKGPVTTQQVYLGDMIIFPSETNSLRGEISESYTLGLKITVKSTDREALNNFIINTGNKLEDYPITETGETVKTDTGDKPYYRCTVKKAVINDSNTEGIKPLYLKQNTNYTLVIAFQQEAVRIITVVPLVEEWLPGEGTTEDPWQDQALGQPQMFDNIVWSDRNLGADHFDATGENYELTIGYYYQPHRNIPYFPFNTRDYYDSNGYMATPPTPEDKRKKKLSVALSYNTSTHRVYPMVDAQLLRMMRQTTGYNTSVGVKGDDHTWTVYSDDLYLRDKDGDFVLDIYGNKISIYNDNRPQMDIPEEKPTNTYFDFYEGIYNKDNKQWKEGPQNQPTNGAWSIPSSKDFMTIFPSTPHAGNFAFRSGGNNGTPMSAWSQYNAMNDDVTTLRVTVPYYVKDMEEPGKVNGTYYRYNATDNYKKAWNTLKENNDPGTTHIGDNTYNVKEPGWENISVEPDGDPDDGYASVYVISRDEGDKYELPKATQDSDPYTYKYKIRSWGTIYAIKRVYTTQAYRMRWRVICADGFGTEDNPVPAFYVEVCRYRCNANDELTEENYKSYDWDHPAARIYFPMCGLVEKGTYYNFGTECNYATSDKIAIRNYKAVVSILQMKVTGDDDSNVYIAIVRDVVDRNYGMQIRPIVGGVK